MRPGVAPHPSWTDRLYLLDTNVVSELRRVRPHGAVLAWIDGVADADLYLSVVSIGEIQAGIERTREQDQTRAAELDAWLEQVAAAYHILPLDVAAMRCWARLMHRRSDTLYEDALIAATALTHRLTVVTRNVRDFEPFAVATFNPFASGTGDPIER